MMLSPKTEAMIKTFIKVTVYFVVAAVLIILGTVSYNFGKDVFANEGYEESPGTEIVVTIDSGDSKMDVAQKLYDNRVVGKKMVYYVQSIIYEAKYIPGTYTLNSSMDGESIIEMLCTKPDSDGESQ